MSDSDQPEQHAENPDTRINENMNETESETDSPAQCATCEVKNFGGEGELIPVWEDPADYKRAESPDYLGCTECNTMRSVDSETEGSQ